MINWAFNKKAKVVPRNHVVNIPYMNYHLSIATDLNRPPAFPYYGELRIYTTDEASIDLTEKIFPELLYVHATGENVQKALTRLAAYHLKAEEVPVKKQASVVFAANLTKDMDELGAKLLDAIQRVTHTRVIQEVQVTTIKSAALIETMMAESRDMFLEKLCNEVMLSYTRSFKIVIHDPIHFTEKFTALYLRAVNLAKYTKNGLKDIVIQIAIMPSFNKKRLVIHVSALLHNRLQFKEVAVIRY